MAIYRKKYRIEGEIVLRADTEDEAEIAFMDYRMNELAAIGDLKTEPPYRDFEAETEDRKKLEAIFREASLG